MAKAKAKGKDKPPKSQIPKFSEIMERVQAETKALADTTVKAFATAELKRFQADLRAQRFASFKAFPLSPRTLDIKKEKHLDLRTMIATKTYVSSMKVMRKVLPDGTIQYHIGFEPHALARDYNNKITDITLNEVAYIQEHGSKAAHIPARPHWRPHLRAMTNRATVLRTQILAATVKLAAKRIKGR